MAKQRLLLFLWAALVSVLVVDPLASSGIAAKGVLLLNRFAARRT